MKGQIDVRLVDFLHCKYKELNTFFGVHNRVYDAEICGMRTKLLNEIMKCGGPNWSNETQYLAPCQTRLTHYLPTTYS